MYARARCLALSVVSMLFFFLYFLAFRFEEKKKQWTMYVNSGEIRLEEAARCFNGHLFGQLLGFVEEVK